MEKDEEKEEEEEEEVANRVPESMERREHCSRTNYIHQTKSPNFF